MCVRVCLFKFFHNCFNCQEYLRSPLCGRGTHMPPAKRNLGDSFSRAAETQHSSTGQSAVVKHGVIFDSG